MDPAALSAALLAVVAPLAEARREGSSAGITVADLPLERPKNRDHGDWASNAALKLSKVVGANPREFAAEIAAGLEAVDGIASVEVAGPGFINIRLDAAAAGALAKTIVDQGTAFGTNDSRADETLTFSQGDRVYTPTEIVDQSGSRLHRLTGEQGPLSVRYDAVVSGPAQGPRSSDLETITYLRPSRYCQSDEVFAQARRQFRGLAGEDLLAAVSGFVASTVTYTPGLSLGTDSAVTTLMTGQGVCRDYAHVVIALLRAMDMPARYAAC